MRLITRVLLLRVLDASWMAGVWASTGGTVQTRRKANLRTRSSSRLTASGCKALANVRGCEVDAPVAAQFLGRAAVTGLEHGASPPRDMLRERHMAPDIEDMAYVLIGMQTNLRQASDRLRSAGRVCRQPLERRG
jgi:hypothetical protein